MSPVEKLKSMTRAETDRVNEMPMALPKRDPTPQVYRAQTISGAMSCMKSQNAETRALVEAEFKKGSVNQWISSDVWAY